MGIFFLKFVGYFNLVLEISYSEEFFVVILVCVYKNEWEI